MTILLQNFSAELTYMTKEAKTKKNVKSTQNKRNTCMKNTSITAHLFDVSRMLLFGVDLMFSITF